jgi:hypothetical protein
MMVGNKARHKPRYVAQSRAEALRPVFDELAKMSDKEAAEDARSMYGARTQEHCPSARWVACYRGSLGAKRRELIQPFKRPFSTSTQFPEGRSSP